MYVLILYSKILHGTEDKFKCSIKEGSSLLDGSTMTTTNMAVKCVCVVDHKLIS